MDAVCLMCAGSKLKSTDPVNVRVLCVWKLEVKKQEANLASLYKFADFIMDHYFYQLVDKPTRVNNILDLVLSNCPISIASVESGPSLADIGVPSDHYPVIFESEVKLELKNAGKRHSYVFKNADFDSLNKDLSLLPLSAGVEEISTPEDLNEAWKQWSDLICHHRHAHSQSSPTWRQ